jgi:hypothetical protein
MSKLTDLGRRLDNINSYIKKDVPKDIWILRTIIPEFINDIKTEATEFEEQKMIEILNELIDQYEFRFNKTFENLTESILTPRELTFMDQLYNQYKQNKKKFIEDYGADAERVMRGRAISLSKKMAEKDNKQKIKEMIKSALTKGPVEEINSAEFVQSRKPIVPIDIEDKEKNPKDIVKMDIPLLIRILEYAREDAETDVNLHFVVENLIELSKDGNILNMNDYLSIISPDEMKK